jgi:hypothetical protein
MLSSKGGEKVAKFTFPRIHLQFCYFLSGSLSTIFPIPRIEELFPVPRMEELFPIPRIEEKLDVFSLSLPPSKEKVSLCRYLSFFCLIPYGVHDVMNS